MMILSIWGQRLASDLMSFWQIVPFIWFPLALLWSSVNWCNMGKGTECTSTGSVLAIPIRIQLCSRQTPWLVIIPSLSCSFYLFVCPNLNGHRTGYKYVEYIFIHKQQQEQQLHLLWSPFTCPRPIPSLIPWSTHILDPASVVASCPVPVYGNKLSALSLRLVSCPGPFD